jgi:hypothetical protein
MVSSCLTATDYRLSFDAQGPGGIHETPSSARLRTVDGWSTVLCVGPRLRGCSGRNGNPLRRRRRRSGRRDSRGRRDGDGASHWRGAHNALEPRGRVPPGRTPGGALYRGRHARRLRAAQGHRRPFGARRNSEPRETSVEAWPAFRIPDGDRRHRSRADGDEHAWRPSRPSS